MKFIPFAVKAFDAAVRGVFKAVPVYIDVVQKDFPAFTFGAAFRDYLTATGSTKGYNGECGAAFLWWDIDRDGNPDATRMDAAKLALAICDRFAVVEDDLLAFYSGSKGFHLGLPVSLWEPPPSADWANQMPPSRS